MHPSWGHSSPCSLPPFIPKEAQPFPRKGKTLRIHCSRSVFQEAPEDRDIVLAGKNLLQCLPSPRDSKVALELYKLSLEIEKLERERDKEKII